MALNAVCLAGVYQKLAPAAARADVKAALCFMQRQVGYTVNAKCDAGSEKRMCATSSTEGFSYIVGCALRLRLRTLWHVTMQAA